ncbi:MAG: UDP-N-acetylmuramate dehydrogenase [Crocinitomicaceae bacterium]|nr:UDP-N-acetylmuramate dehydrogenase [Crocinitomicaceae bacterium]
MPEIKSNFSLKNFNTFSIDVKCKFFTSFTCSIDLNQILSKHSNDSLLILGGGSNLLFTKDFEGIVLKNEVLGKEIIEEDDSIILIKVGAGENWHEFVMWCIDNNYGGLENLSLIPGNVGASPMQNIGAYGVEIQDVFAHLTAYNIETGELEVFDNKACEFGYRESVFKRKLKGKYIIMHVVYRLSKNHVIKTKYGAINAELQKMKVKDPSIRDISNAVINIRRSKLPDPNEIGNAGSFFKNPVVRKDIVDSIKNKYPDIPVYELDNQAFKIPAGWLIETAGWKGKTFDNYGVHKNQALVLVNYSDAKGNNIYDLSSKIIADIQSKFEIVLEREVNVI